MPPITTSHQRLPRVASRVRASTSTTTANAPSSLGSTNTPVGRFVDDRSPAFRGDFVKLTEHGSGPGHRRGHHDAQQATRGRPPRSSPAPSPRHTSTAPISIRFIASETYGVRPSRPLSTLAAVNASTASMPSAVARVGPGQSTPVGEQHVQPERSQGDADEEVHGLEASRQAWKGVVAETDRERAQPPASTGWLAAANRAAAAMARTRAARACRRQPRPHGADGDAYVQANRCAEERTADASDLVGRPTAAFIGTGPGVGAPALGAPVRWPRRRRSACPRP